MRKLGVKEAHSVGSVVKQFPKKTVASNLMWAEELNQEKVLSGIYTPSLPEPSTSP